MSQEDGYDETLNVMRELMLSDREFYRNIRLFSGDTRSSVAVLHERNISNIVSFLRLYTAYQRTQQQPVRLTMNIPLFDVSGNFLDPVPVVPTQAQITRAIENNVQVTDTTCSICQEPVTQATRIRHCGHCFHESCIGQWFSMNPRCPMCRVDIREGDFRIARQNLNNDSSSHSYEE